MESCQKAKLTSPPRVPVFSARCFLCSLTISNARASQCWQSALSRVSRSERSSVDRNERSSVVQPVAIESPSDLPTTPKGLPRTSCQGGGSQGQQSIAVALVECSFAACCIACAQTREWMQLVINGQSLALASNRTVASTLEEDVETHVLLALRRLYVRVSMCESTRLTAVSKHGD